MIWSCWIEVFVWNHNEHFQVKQVLVLVLIMKNLIQFNWCTDVKSIQWQQQKVNKSQYKSEWVNWKNLKYFNWINLKINSNFKLKNKIVNLKQS